MSAFDDFDTSAQCEEVYGEPHDWPIDGQRRSKKRTNPIRAAYYARRRAVRFARFLGFSVPRTLEDYPS